jgi:uncharacterized membrane protein YhaH (DUF805 family)
MQNFWIYLLFNIIIFQALIYNSITNIQQNAELFQFMILYLKHLCLQNVGDIMF